MSGKFEIGAQARTTVDDADGTGLPKGTVVIIRGLTGDRFSGEMYAVIAVLTPDLTPVALAVNRKHLELGEFPHPDSTLTLDAEEREHFDDIIDLDPLLRTLVNFTGDVDATDELEPNGGGVAVQERPEVEEERAESRPGRPPLYFPKEHEDFTIGDAAGDVTRFSYREFDCENHGLEAYLRVTVDGEEGEAQIPIPAFPQLAQFFQRVAAFYLKRKNVFGEGLDN